MLILIDEALPQAVRRFSTVGEVRTFPGRALTSDMLAGADALIVRSVTRVNAALVAGSSLRFVGTVTAGTDHLDLPGLAAQGIHVASAPGFNARPVAEYVLTAILLLADRHGFDPVGKTLGVVGVGRVGSIVADWATALGMRVLRNDPPRQAQEGSKGGDWVGVEELLSLSNIVTLHVPLNRDGFYPTVSMVNQRWLQSMRRDAFLINASRGEVIDESKLIQTLDERRLAGVALDVWHNEPRINRALARRVDFATPHVAGYSQESKQRGVEMIFNKFCREMCIEVPSPVEAAHAIEEKILIDDCRIEAKKTHTCLLETLVHACDIPAMHNALMKSIEGPGASEQFEMIRASFAARHEFTAYRIGADDLDQLARVVLTKCGFDMAAE